MILGRLRTKRRKEKVSSVEYLIHVKQISPWHVSNTQNPEETVLLQWEGGNNKNHGSITSVVGDEKIEFNESFKLPVTLTRESHWRSITGDGYQKNCLDFHLYESRNDKGLKHLGSASINLADYGVIEDTVAINTPINLKKSTRSAPHPVLHVSVQSIDKDSTSSSPKGKHDDEESVYNDDESVYNDDDNASVQSSHTTSSTSEVTTHPNEKFSDEPTRAAPASPEAEEFYDPVNSDFLNRTKSAKDTEPDVSSGGASANSEKKTTAKSWKDLNNVTLKSTTEAAKDRTKTVNVEPAVSSGAGVASSDKNTVTESFKHQNKSTTESTQESAKTVNVDPAVSASSDKHLVAESVKHLNQITALSTTESENDRTKPVNMEPVVEPVVSSGGTFAHLDKNPVAESIKQLNKIATQNTAESEKDRTKTVHMEPAVSSGATFANSDKNPVTDSSKHQNKSKTQDTTKSAKEGTEASHMEPAAVLSRTMSGKSNENSVAEPLKSQNKSKVHNKVESARDSADTIHVGPAPRSENQSVDKNSVAEPSENQNNSSASQSTVDMTSFRKIVERRKKASDGSAIVRKAAQQSKRASSFTAADLGMNSDSVSFSESQITHEDDTRAGRQSKDSTTSVPENKNKIELQKNGQDKQEMEVKEKNSEDEQLSESSQSNRKGIGSWARTRSTSRNAEQGNNMVPNDNLKHMKSRNLSFNSAKSNGPSSNKELRVRSMENDVPEDTRTGSKSPTVSETKGMKNDFSDSKDGLKSENEILKEELREAAAVEVALYSVVAEHGNSANKVHAPARRLSRFYFHACKEGSRPKMAGAARTSISGLILVARACGNDVPRLTFWLSNSIVLRATVCQASGSLLSSAESDIVQRRHKSSHEKEKNNSMSCFEDWENIHTFIAALEKVEGWIFSRIVESVWWQTLTPYMQSDVAKNTSPRKPNRRKHSFGDPDQVNFSIDLWKKAFKDACERLCPLRAGGLQCGCLTVLARLVMEQLVNRLDVAMFNAILRDSADEMPTDPLSDPISDPNVLPVPAGRTCFGAGAQLKSSIGNWSRWLTDLFGIDDDPSVDSYEPYVAYAHQSGSSFKPFYLLKSLSDLLMLPFDLLADGSTRQEVCPCFGAQFIKKVLINFVPDEFSPGLVPESVFEVLDSEVFLEVGKEYIRSVPCNAAPTVYSPPKAAALKSIIGDFKGHRSPTKGASLLRKAYASDDELDELDSPIKSISIDCVRVSPCSPTPKPKGKPHKKAMRYQLLREVWDDEN